MFPECSLNVNRFACPIPASARTPGDNMGPLGLTFCPPVTLEQQALAQCENYLDKLGVIKEAMHDTAGAAQLIQNEKLE